MEYKIGEFSRLTGFSDCTLRFYENEGILKPKRNSNNIRVYTDSDRQWMEFITHLKNTGMSIQDIVRYKQLKELDAENGSAELINMLVIHREKVWKQYKSLENNLKVLDKKIESYQNQAD